MVARLALVETYPWENYMISTYLNMLRLKAQELVSDEDGQDLIEYALLAVLISVACVAAIGPVATAIQTVFSTISSDM